MAKLQLLEFMTTNSYKSKTCIAAATVCESDDVQVPTILPNVAHPLVSNHHIRKPKSAETEGQSSSLGTLHHERLDSQIQWIQLPLELYNLQGSDESKISIQPTNKYLICLIRPSIRYSVLFSVIMKSNKISVAFEPKQEQGKPSQVILRHNLQQESLQLDFLTGLMLTLLTSCNHVQSLDSDLAHGI